MNHQESVIRNDLWQRLREVGRLTPELESEISERFGERGRKAIATVKEGRVKRYCDFFVVVGYHDEYVVEEDFCICRDFLFRGKECSHILAVMIAEATGMYETFALWYVDAMEGEPS